MIALPPPVFWAAQAVPQSPATAEDIVVTARRSKCVVTLADKPLTGQRFDEHARDWAGGRPVRVIARRDEDLKCLSKVAFRLADKGVRLIEFVSPKDAAAAR